MRRVWIIQEDLNEINNSKTRFANPYVEQYLKLINLMLMTYLTIQTSVTSSILLQKIIDRLRDDFWIKT